MTNEIKKVSEETEQYIKSSEIADRLEKRGKVSFGGAAAASRIKQRFTEEQILLKKAQRQEKNDKFKAKLKKSKANKLKTKSEKPIASIKSVNVFGTSK